MAILVSMSVSSKTHYDLFCPRSQELQLTNHAALFHSENPFSDPIKLLRRIRALEKSVQALVGDGSRMVQRRQHAVVYAVEQLSMLREQCQNQVSHILMVRTW